MKTKALLILLFAHFSVILSAQGIVSDDYVNSEARITLSEDLSLKESEYDLMEHGELAFSIAYRNTLFLNNSYMDSKDAGFMKAHAGISFSMELFLLKHFSFDATFFGNKYDIDHSSFEGTVKHAGTELFINGYILPDLNDFTFSFCPFIGAGYQFSRLCNVATGQNEPRINTSGPMLKAGTKIYYKEQHYLCAQYKQSFPTKEERMFRSYEIGLGIIF